MAHSPRSTLYMRQVRSARDRPSVMFSVTYEDGRTAYFAAEGHGGPDRDYRATSMVQERQRAAELPKSLIRSVKRVR